MSPRSAEGPAGQRPRGTLSFCAREGSADNCLFRDPTTTAHVLVSSGPRGRVVVAFPARNEGAALWLRAPGGGPARLRLERVTSAARGGLRGVRFRVTSETPLALEQALVGSVRTIRSYQHAGRMAFHHAVVERAARALRGLPPQERAAAAGLGFTPEALRARARAAEQLVAERVSPARLRVEGRGLDGAQRISLALESAAAWDPRAGRLVPRGRGAFDLTVEVLTDAPALAGIPRSRLLRRSARALVAQARGPRAEQLQRALRGLSFLATERKYLAGSWRFLTYFGRDTLMSIWLLRPLLSLEALEAGLQSVLDRLSEEGRVAHEESIGDQAVVEHLERFARQVAERQPAAALDELRRAAAPVHDYKMVDDDFMLPCVAAAYLTDRAVSAARARRFFARRTAAGRTNLEALAANLRLVLAKPLAEGGQLVALQPGIPVGDWRDSEEGLGGGRAPASVNLYLVPAALRAAAQLAGSRKIALGPLLGPLLGARDAAGQTAQLRRLEAAERRWLDLTAAFRVQLSAEDVRGRLRRFLREAPLGARERELLRVVQLDAGGATVADFVAGRATPAALTDGLAFDALALDARGAPIAVMHSDDGFALFAGDVAPEALERLLVKYELPYPVGLRDAYGVYVASPVLSQRVADYATFDRGHYHGTVVWAWQQSMLALGLMRQLERLRGAADRATAPLQRRIERVLRQIAAAERRAGALRQSELWTVEVAPRGFAAAAFGGRAGHKTESNVVQLWSSVMLAVEAQRARLGL